MHVEGGRATATSVARCDHGALDVRRLRDAFVAALIVAAATAGLLRSPPARADELSDLRDAVKKLEARINTLEAERAAAAAKAPEAKMQPAAPTPVPPEGVATYVPPVTLKSDETAAQRVDNAVIDPTLKGFFRIPGTDSLMKIGGYAKVDFIYDTKPIGSFDYFVTSQIPTSGPDTNRGSQFTVQAKQTRMNVDVRRDTEWGAARLFVEADWFGNASFDFSPGSYQFHLRHAFGQVGNIAAGYSFSAFMDNDAFPDTLDFEGPNSGVFLTDAAARYSWKLGKNWSVALAAEAPDAQVTAPVGGGRSTMPDIIGRARYESEGGHVQIGGVVRRIGWRSGGDASDTVGGYGINVAGSLKTFGDDYMVLGGVWGKGIARYVNDITGLGLDAVVSPQGQLEALEAYGGYAGYTHYWNPKLRSTAVAGYLGMNNKSFQSPTSFDSSQYYSANVIWNPVGSFNAGLEVLYGRHKTLDGFSANDTRIQASMQYDFVR
jgi:DcaP outer membrane protein